MAVDQRDVPSQAHSDAFHSGSDLLGNINKPVGARDGNRVTRYTAQMRALGRPVWRELCVVPHADG